MKTEAIEDVFELSPLQQGILFQTLHTGAEMYVQQFSFTITAPVNVDLYRRAWQTALDRHGALRASFYWEEVEQPVQVVQRDLRIPLHYEDWSSLPPSQQTRRLETYLQHDRSSGFDLSEPPLIRIKLICLACDCYQLIITFHHIILDGWSLAKLFAEVTSYYEAYFFGRQLQLPAAAQYGTYIGWLQAQDPARSDTYWSKVLAGYRGPVPLHLDRSRGGILSTTEGSKEKHLTISAETTATLRAFARRHQLTLNTLVQAAWAILMSKFTGEEDVVFGAVVSGRPALLEDVESIIGLFINTLPVRVFVGRDDLLPWLKQLQADQLKAHEFAYSPLNRIQSFSETPRGTPLFHTLLTFENFPLWQSGNHASNGVIAKTDFFEGNDYSLSIKIVPLSELAIKIAYQASFEDAAISRLLDQFCQLLQEMVINPHRRLSELSLLDAAEECRMLALSQGTPKDYPHDACIHELFEEQVARTPDAVAIICGNKTLTYRQFDTRANQLARYLQRQGVGPECVVATYLERSSELLIGIMAILKCGAAYLPLDPDLPVSRIAWMVSDARPRAVLTSANFRETVAWNCPVVCVEDDQSLSGEGIDRLSVRVLPQNLAYLIYTSGTTGIPKGVLVEHRSVVNHGKAIAEEYGLTQADRVLQFTSVGFDVFGEELFPTLLSGAAVVPRQEDLVASFEALHSRITNDHITVLNLPGSYWEEWVSYLTHSQLCPPPSVRLVVVGNERISVERWKEWLNLAGPVVQLRNAYGPTESTITTTVYSGAELNGDVDSVPLGRAIANTAVFILDPELRPVPFGVPGELYVGGKGIARGYLNHPDLTAAAFVPDPYGSGSRLYRTGDIGQRLPDGNIAFLGRRDTQVKVTGHRVELGEIEAVLSSHESVKSCAVAAHKDEAQRTRLVGYVVPERGKPELWPSIGEYFLYDPVMYHAMTHDERRNRAYRAAIEREVKDKVVLDIGTGADAVLTRMCLDAGARRVYAIEKIRSSYEQARDLLAKLKLADRAIVLHGESASIELPEKVDVCVSELLGMIGSSEGVIPILNDARRFLKAGGTMIPSRCLTKIAAVTLPDDLARQPRFTELSGPYVQQIFELLGHPIDVRVCINNFPETNVVSDEQVFEDLDFAGLINTELHCDISLTINRDARVDGFLLWLNLFTGPHELIDSLHESYVWLPVFFPAFSPGVNVSRGDVIHATCSVGPSDAVDTPDYRIQGRVVRKLGAAIPFAYESFHSRMVFKQSAFHRALFADGWESRFEQLIQLAPVLQSFLRERLPHYMVPTSFITMKSLPLLPNHKVDRRLLPAPEDVRGRQKHEPEPPRNEIEEKLVRLWADALLIQRVGIHDNFFELGGDSIVSIQLVSRARREGIGITVNQVFQYPTIAQLALVAETAAPLTAAQGRVMGDVPLTPIQHWFFEQNFVNPNHSNQAAFFEISMPLSLPLISKAVQAVVQHHDALRLRFESTEAGWRQFHVSDDMPVEVETINLSSVPAIDQAERMEASAATIQTGLDISRGPMMRVALFDLGPGRSQHLLFVIHHLVVDTVSWRILLEDFWNAYSQLARSETIQLPPKTTSFQAWSQQLSQYVRSPSLQQEVNYWLQPIEHDYRLPVDLVIGDNTVASARTITVKLNSQETQALLQEVPKAYQTQINDVLLTALVQAFQAWTGVPKLRIDLEGHGREEVIKGVDVSRTVGWFTSLFPVQLDLTGISEPGAALKSIKEQLRGVPNGGIGYGLLRYLGNDEPVKQRLHSLPPAQISFNFRSHADPAESPIVTAAASYGPVASPSERRRTLLDINAVVVAQSELQFVWTYSEHVYRRLTIETLSNNSIEALRRLIAHCQSAGAGGYTPSDFSKARLSQTELDSFLGDLELQRESTSQ